MSRIASTHFDARRDIRLMSGTEGEESAPAAFSLIEIDRGSKNRVQSVGFGQIIVVQQPNPAGIVRPNRFQTEFESRRGSEVAGASDDSRFAETGLLGQGCYRALGAVVHDDYTIDLRAGFDEFQQLQQQMPAVAVGNRHDRYRTGSALCRAFNWHSARSPSMDARTQRLFNILAIPHTPHPCQLFTV